MSDTKQTLQERVTLIITEAVESRIDWESYYSGESPEAVVKIMVLINQELSLLEKKKDEEIAELKKRLDPHETREHTQSVNRAFSGGGSDLLSNQERKL